MSARGSLATVAMIVGSMCGCAAQAGQDDPSEEAAAEDQPLDLTVDSLDVVHGALRISATMVDGAADVSVRLGGDCEPREVGGGLSTLSTLVWALADTDVADSIGCGLAVRARVREGPRMVNKVAELAVAVSAGAPESQNPDDGPQLQSVRTAAAGIGLVLSPVTRGARLTTGDSLLEGARPPSDDEAPEAPEGASLFTVPFIDLARSILQRRPLVLEGSSFVISLTVQGMPLQDDPPSAEAVSVEGDLPSAEDEPLQGEQGEPAEPPDPG
jgi:hypothetical protein